MSKDYALKHPIFGIDTEYYKTNLTTKYLQKFLQDVIGESFETHNADFYQFEEDLFVKKYQNVNYVLEG